MRGRRCAVACVAPASTAVQNYAVSDEREQGPETARWRYPVRVPARPSSRTHERGCASAAADSRHPRDGRPQRTRARLPPARDDPVVPAACACWLVPRRRPRPSAGTEECEEHHRPWPTRGPRRAVVLGEEDAPVRSRCSALPRIPALAVAHSGARTLVRGSSRKLRTRPPPWSLARPTPADTAVL
jgi:hypothetical protein